MTNEEAISIIKIIGEDYTPRTTFQEVNEALDLAIKALEERPQGEWVIDQEGDKHSCTLVTCPFCGERHCCKMNFCGNCGAKMKEGAEE